MIDRKELLRDGPEGSPFTVVLAHGAGAPMDSPFMEEMARGIADAGLAVVRFEFAYMKRRRDGGRRGPPDPASMLEDRWRMVIEHLGSPERLVIGGKSLGGRIASMVADSCGVAGLVCLGYPFHPPRKPEKLRTAHLTKLRTPTLIVQGERDPFGTPDEVRGYGLPPSVRTEWLGDGDHSFKPRVKSGRTLEQTIGEAVELVSGFVRDLD